MIICHKKYTTQKINLFCSFPQIILEIKKIKFSHLLIKCDIIKNYDGNNSEAKPKKYKNKQCDFLSLSQHADLISYVTNSRHLAFKKTIIFSYILIYT